MRRLLSFLILFVALLVAHSLPVLALDFNADGLDDVFLFYEYDDVVVVQTIDGIEITRIDVPGKYRDEPALLFPAVHNGEAAVFSVDSNKSKLLTKVHILSESGFQGTVDLGAMKGATALAYEVNGDGQTTDLLTVAKDGELTVRYNPFANGAANLSQPTPAKKHDLVSLTRNESGNYAIAIFRGKGKRKKNGKYSPKRTELILHELSNGSQQSYPIKIKVKEAPLPILNSGTPAPLEFLNTTKRNKSYTEFSYHNIGTGEEEKSVADPNVVLTPGTFVGSGSGRELLVSRGSSARVYDLLQGSTILAELALPFTSNEGGGDPIGGQYPFVPGENCITTYPTSLVNQIAIAWAVYDFTAVQELISQVPWAQLCPDLALDVQDDLNAIFENTPGTRSALTSTAGFVLGAPIFDGRSAGGLPGGCDKIRDNSDGPQGFLYKMSDHHPHNPVILLPSSVNAKKAYLATKSGKKQKNGQMKYTGRSNGYRQTFRLSKPGHTYKTNAMVVAVVETYEGTQKWCWKGINVNGRND